MDGGGLRATGYVSRRYRRHSNGTQVQLSSPFEGRVIQPDNSIHLVNLTDRTCTCFRYQANEIPCGHAMACIFSQGLTLEPFLPSVLSTATWANSFAAVLPPVSIENLSPAPDDECNPPITRVPRGRPKKERIRREDARGPRGLQTEDMGAMVSPSQALVHRCGTCGETGHNASTCRRPHQ